MKDLNSEPPLSPPIDRHSEAVEACFDDLSVDRTAFLCAVDAAIEWGLIHDVMLDFWRTTQGHPDGQGLAQRQNMTYFLQRMAWNIVKENEDERRLREGEA